VTGNIMSQILSDSEVVLHINEWHCPAWVLTFAFLLHHPCCCRHYQLIEASVEYCWCLSPVELSLKLSQNYWFGKMFWQEPRLFMLYMYTILHSVCCLLGCKLLTFLHPVVPHFTFPTIHSIEAHISNSVFFWILYTALVIWLNCQLLQRLSVLAHVKTRLL